MRATVRRSARRARGRAGAHVVHGLVDNGAHRVHVQTAAGNSLKSPRDSPKSKSTATSVPSPLPGTLSRMRDPSGPAGSAAVIAARIMPAARAMPSSRYACARLIPNSAPQYPAHDACDSATHTRVRVSHPFREHRNRTPDIADRPPDTFERLATRESRVWSGGAYRECPKNDRYARHPGTLCNKTCTRQ